MPQLHTRTFHEKIGPSDDSSTSDTTEHDSPTLKTKCGLPIESYEAGGIVEVIYKDEVQFWRDIGPFFKSSMIIVGTHLVYYLTGNLLILLFFANAQMIIIDWILYDEETIDKQNVSKKNEKTFLQDWRFNIPLWACVFFDTVTWLWGLFIMSDHVGKYQEGSFFYLSDQVRPKTWPQYFVFTFTVGFFTSFSCTAGHELIHRRDWLNKIIGQFSFAKYFYSHFLDEHVQGHHKLMATPEDSASSRLNESLWMFILREFKMGHQNSWNREVRRIKKIHGENVSTLSILFNNKMTLYFLVHVSMIIIIYTQLGLSALGFQLAYTFWGIFFLDLANYFEHYGLERRKDKNGIYESINKYHSWNHVSTTMYFRLQRHSDHHIASFRQYQILRRWDDVPWCPFQTHSCLWTTLIPSLWYYCMNPRVEAVQNFLDGKRNKSKASFTNLKADQTEHDKQVKNLVWVYLTLITVVFGYFAFFTNHFYTYNTK